MAIKALTPMSDQDRISPYNINTLSPDGRHKRNIDLGYYLDIAQNYLSEY